MDDLIREFLIAPLASAAEAFIFTEVVNNVVALLRRKKTETREALLRVRGARAEDLPGILHAMDGDVKAALLEVANGPSVTTALDAAMTALHSRDLDVNQLLDMVSIGYKVAAFLRDRSQAASNEQGRLARFAKSLRDQQSAIIALKEDYLSDPVFDQDKARDLNAQAELLTMTLRNFKTAVAGDAA